MKGNVLRYVIRDTLPVLTGYLALGMGFGVLMQTNGYGILLPIMMSIFIFSGSMQYAAVGLLTSGASMLTVALTTLVVNARYFFYGISMAKPYRKTGAAKPYLIFALTDETYSLVCSGEKDLRYCLLVSLFDHIYWITGTLLGTLLSSAVTFNSRGIEFAQTALFLTVFTEQWLNTKNHIPAVTGVALTVLCVLAFGSGNFLIPAMLAITAALFLERRVNQ